MNQQRKYLYLCLLMISVQLSRQDDIFLGENHVPGFIQLNDEDDLFFWLFKSRNDINNDPLVVWLTGGPGCSSEVAIFGENGPFSVKDDLSLKRNDFSWNNNANVLYVDQPVGTGFSKARIIDYVHSEKEIAEEFYQFIVKFIAKYPEFNGRELFITGESYAGHYIPAISAFIHQQKNPLINLVGFAIGNGWTSPYIQYPAYNQFSYENKLIGTIQYNLLKAGFLGCQAIIKTGIWFAALETCQLMVTSILGNPIAPRFNVYDIRKKCEHPPLCYDFSNVDKFLAREDVIQALGVQGRKWQDCNMEVHTMLLGDWILDLSDQVAYLLDNGVKGLVYSGDKDFICNWRGGEAWTNQMNWSGKEEFNNAKYQDWTLNGNSAGQYKETQNLVFLRVYEAGHMVPMDQPQAAVAMLNQFFGKWAMQSRIQRNMSV